MKLIKLIKEYLEICYFYYSKKISALSIKKNQSNNLKEKEFQRKE